MSLLKTCGILWIVVLFLSDVTAQCFQTWDFCAVTDRRKKITVSYSWGVIRDE
jgi:hypothetical protein